MTHPPPTPPKAGRAPSNRSSANGNDLTLALHGPARLELDGRAVKLHRKALAILYYLALQGPSSRQFLADLLWGHTTSLQNLRVELHHLRDTLKRHGFLTFRDRSDPLVLPDVIRLDDSSRNGDPLEGLDDLTPEFQAWLDVQRSHTTPLPSAQNLRQDLVRTVARSVRLPYLLILTGQPDAGQYAFAEALARTLTLPIARGASGASRSVKYVDASAPHDDALLERILTDTSSLWVLERSPFGEDSAFLLRLRSRFAAERSRYLELPPLEYGEARAQLLKNLSERDAADLFTFTGGHYGFLRELVLLRATHGDADAPQVPQRIRAAYQTEARYLGIDARFALERASVHPGSLPEGFIAALGIEEHLIELERRGWLAFDGAWRFADATARTVLYHSLPRGQARQCHQRAALQFALDGDWSAEAFHRAMADGTVDWEAMEDRSDGWARALASDRLGRTSSAPAPVTVEAGPERALLEATRSGPGVDVRADEVTIRRSGSSRQPSVVEWQLPADTTLVTIRGFAFVRNAVEVGIDGNAVPLSVQAVGARGVRSALLANVSRPQSLDDGGLLLPLPHEVDCAFLVDGAHTLRLSSRAEAAIVSLRLRAEAVVAKPGLRSVRAYALRCGG